METKMTDWLYPDAIVESDWLATHLDDPKLRIFECTTYLRYTDNDPNLPYIVESGHADYETAHIKGAAFFDLQNELSNPDSPYRFTLPEYADLAGRFAEKGVGDDTRLILYSRGGNQWSTRIWWMLRSVGFDNAAILNGGWEKWDAEKRLTESGGREYPSASLTANPRPELFVGKDEVLAAIGDAGICTLNALSADMHSGENPRYGRAGRVPGSVNVPAVSLFNQNDKTFLPLDAVQNVFDSVGISRDQRVINYCGGGIAATLDAFLLHQLGYENLTVYDDSMSQWATDESLPIETD
jgi:thiosulfate/3-mercaptopyruvate sulfurtransferase